MSKHRGEDPNRRTSWRDRIYLVDFFIILAALGYVALAVALVVYT